MSSRTRARPRVHRRRRVEVLAGDPAGWLADLALDIEIGLTADRKHLPKRWLFDTEGVRLLRRIRDQPEHYQVRAERELLADRAYALSLYFPDCAPLFVEVGVIDAGRTTHLIEPLIEKFGALQYMAVGPDCEAVQPPCSELVARHPGLRATAMVGRLTDAIQAVRAAPGPAILYWPESGVAGSDRAGVKPVLREIVDGLRGVDLFIGGIDLRKDARLVQRAYRDRSGCGRRLQLNALERLNDQFDATFDLSNFRDRVTYDEPIGRLEACLVSRRSHRVRIEKLGLDVTFAKGETIQTITVTKFSPREIDQTAESVGWVVHERWYDRNGRVSANLMRRRPRLRAL